MKIALLLLCVIACGCGGSSMTLTKAWYGGEQARIDAYYGARASGFAYSDAFYAQSDSILNAASGTDAKILTPIYSSVDGGKLLDSLNIWKADAERISYFGHLQHIVDATFTIAKGVYRK